MDGCKKAGAGRGGRNSGPHYDKSFNTMKVAFVLRVGRGGRGLLQWLVYSIVGKEDWPQHCRGGPTKEEFLSDGQGSGGGGGDDGSGGKGGLSGAPARWGEFRPVMGIGMRLAAPPETPADCP